ncbi:class II glutamine amidotransferase [Cooperia oncophora]
MGFCRILLPTHSLHFSTEELNPPDLLVQMVLIEAIWILSKDKDLHGMSFVEEKLSKLNGSRIIIGHNRYSTAGKKRWAINCVQPFVVYTAIGTVAIAHNGELVDVKKKRKEVLHEGVGLSTDTDSELIAQMVAKAIALNYKCRSGLDWGDISKELAVTMSSLNMSYSLVVMTYDRLYAIRDPYGNRPLCVGTIYDTKQCPSVPLAYIAASETCALPSFGKLNFEVQPGEIVELSRKGIRSVYQVHPLSCFRYVLPFIRGRLWVDEPE